MISQRLPQSGSWSLHVLLVAGSLVFSSAPLMAEDYTIDDVVNGLRDWRLQLSNFRLEYQSYQMAHLRNRFPEMDDEQIHREYQHVTTFQWTDTGHSLWSDEMIAPDDVHRKNVIGSNGKVRWNVDYRDSQMEMHRTRRAPSDRVTLSIIICPLHGLWFGREGLWLDEYLVQNGAEIIGMEVLDGMEYVKVNCRLLENVDSAIYYLDQTNSFLPRRIVSAKNQLAYEVHQFKLVDGRIAFPVQGLCNLNPDLVDYLAE